MSNKVYFKIGLVEFRAEGDSDFIAREREEFADLLSDPAVAQHLLTVDDFDLDVADEDEDEDAPEDFDEEEETADEPEEPEEEVEEAEETEEPPVEESTEESAPASIAEFLDEKGFDTNVGLVLGIGYYVSKIEKKGTFTSSDINEKLAEAARKKPSNISQVLGQNVKKGYLTERKNKDGRKKVYAVSKAGVAWCESHAPSDAAEK